MSKWRSCFFRITVEQRAAAEIEEHKRQFYDQSRVSAISSANMEYHKSEVARLQQIISAIKTENKVDFDVF